jgi:DNA-directed RNA polymerase sigma subunit (sigma70/sigma32)
MTFNERIKREARERAAKVSKMRKAGLTWTQVGNALGVTRQRAQQIGKRNAA